MRQKGVQQNEGAEERKYEETSLPLITTLFGLTPAVSHRNMIGLKG